MMRKIWHTFGILAPRSWYCRGFFKKLTNSKISTLASSQPATSLNRTPMLPFIILALDSLMLNGFPRPLPPRPPPIGPCRVAKSKNPTSSKVGRIVRRSVLWGERWESTWTHPVHIKNHLNLIKSSDEILTRRFHWCRIQVLAVWSPDPFPAGPFPGYARTSQHCQCWTTKSSETHKNMQHIVQMFIFFKSQSMTVYLFKENDTKEIHF